MKSSLNDTTMQILFISEESEIIKFLSGLQAEAIMAHGNVEVSGMPAQSMVTVICSGLNAHFYGTLIRVDNGYPTGDGKWLSLKFQVRRIISLNEHDLERAGVQ